MNENAGHSPHTSTAYETHSDRHIRHQQRISYRAEFGVAPVSVAEQRDRASSVGTMVFLMIIGGIAVITAALAVA